MRTAWRTATIFISSTFRDMHAERDELRALAFPGLEERLRPHLIRVETVDLRWGVDTSDQGEVDARMRAILSVCFDEIDRARPFFIGILGGRYGWRPPAELAGRVAAERGVDFEPGVSVTELEIRQAFTRGAPYVYLREDAAYEGLSGDARARYLEADAEAAERLCALKARLNEQAPERLRRYPAHWDAEAGRFSGLGALCRMVEDDLLAEILNAFPPADDRTDDPFSAMRAALDDWRAEAETGFIGRAPERANLFGFLSGEAAAERPTRLCVAPPGAGASTLLARVERDLETAGVRVLTHAAGAPGAATDLAAILAFWLAELGSDPADAADLETAFADALAQTAAQAPVAVILDDLDALEPTARARSLAWLPLPLPNGVRLVVSAAPGPARDAATLRRDVEETPLAPFAPMDAAALVEALCARSGRSLPQPARAALLERERVGEGGPGNPLWISLAVAALNALDQSDFAQIEATEGDPEAVLGARLTEETSRFPEDLSELFFEILQRLETRFGWERVRPPMLALALSRRGWRARDLERIVKNFGGDYAFDAVVFASIRRWLRGRLRVDQSDGRFQLSHPMLLDAYRARIAYDAERVKGYNQCVADALLSLPKDDPVRRRELVRHAALGESFTQALDDWANPELSATEEAEALEAVAELMVEAVDRDDSGPFSWLSWILDMLFRVPLGKDEADQVRHFMTGFQRIGTLVTKQLARPGRAAAKEQALEWLLRNSLNMVADGDHWAFITRDMTLFWWGEFTEEHGRLDETDHALRERAQIAEKALATVSSEDQRVWRGSAVRVALERATLAARRGAWDDAKTRLDEAEAAMSRLDPSHPEIQAFRAALESRRGDLARRTADFGAARRWARETAARYAEHEPDDRAKSLERLLEQLKSVGADHEALPIAEELLALNEARRRAALDDVVALAWIGVGDQIAADVFLLAGDRARATALVDAAHKPIEEAHARGGDDYALRNLICSHVRRATLALTRFDVHAASAQAEAASALVAGAPRGDGEDENRKNLELFLVSQVKNVETVLQRVEEGAPIETALARMIDDEGAGVLATIEAGDLRSAFLRGSQVLDLAAGLAERGGPFRLAGARLATFTAEAAAQLRDVEGAEELSRRAARWWIAALEDDEDDADAAEGLYFCANRAYQRVMNPATAALYRQWRLIEAHAIQAKRRAAPDDVGLARAMAGALGGAGQGSLWLGDVAGAERQLRASLSLAEQVASAYGPAALTPEGATWRYTRGASYFTLGEALEALERPDEAIDAFDTGADILRSALRANRGHMMALPSLLTARERAARTVDAAAEPSRLRALTLKWFDDVVFLAWLGRLDEAIDAAETTARSLLATLDEAGMLEAARTRLAELRDDLEKANAAAAPRIFGGA